MASLDTLANPAVGTRIPVYQDYMNPILDALRSAGRPLTIEELGQRVAESMALAANVVAIPHDPEVPDRSEVGYRMAWARTYLKKAGLLVNPKQGTWALTQQGRSVGQVDARVLSAEVVRKLRESGAAAGDPDDAVPVVRLCA